MITTRIPMNVQSIGRQKKRQTWDRTQRRENREFLRRYYGDMAKVIDVIYHGSRRDARKYLVYS